MKNGELKKWKQNNKQWKYNRTTKHRQKQTITNDEELMLQELSGIEIFCPFQLREKLEQAGM
jgi:hypothetical protein